MASAEAEKPTRLLRRKNFRKNLKNVAILVFYVIIQAIFYEKFKGIFAFLGFWFPAIFFQQSPKIHKNTKILFVLGILRNIEGFSKFLRL